MKAHGWEDTAQKLYRMSVEGKWSQMAAEVTDEMLDTFAVVGTYDEIVDRIKARYGPYATAILLPLPSRTPEERERARDILRQLRAS